MNRIFEIDKQVEKELACIEDLYVYIRVYHQREEFELAAMALRDIQKSNNHILELKKEREQIVLERSQFQTIIQSLSERGVLAKSVRKVKEDEHHMASC